MQTQVFLVDKDKPNRKILEKAAAILTGGGLVAFPTETVYGLGANGLDAEATGGIYRAKGRPSDNPLILHIAEQAALQQLVTTITPSAKALIDQYWPGPLTVVLPRAAIIPDVITGGLDTVAVRMPDSVVARELIALAGVPIAAPSANTSGRPSPTSAQMVITDLGGKIDAVIDAGPCTVGVESTVVDCTTPVPTLLRPGGITLEMLIATLGAVDIDQALMTKEAIPRSPGMKYTHYAPQAPMTLLEGQPDKVAEALRQQVDKAIAEGKTVGAVVSQETAVHLNPAVKAAIYGLRCDAATIAANLYAALRYFDEQPVDVIFAEGISEKGLGLAVMNRLRKASGHRTIRA
ncbi:Threonylcarbamoyl-AMP synthase [bioreactor metagenome]|uniref:Threonylcarbamoyl-AMP synthase n=1 Tax=bioreactor metagenome TaxID=1076179 RepID=A0A644TRA0_9ZZZZ|nr:L-threonylcarbamoyladenylate synthase [Negativicutes bacterium]